MESGIAFLGFLVIDIDSEVCRVVDVDQPSHCLVIPFLGCSHEFLTFAEVHLPPWLPHFLVPFLELFSLYGQELFVLGFVRVAG